MRYAIVLLACAAALPPASGQTAPATRPATAPAAPPPAKANADDPVRYHAQSFGGLFQLRVENGDLVLRTALPASNNFRMIDATVRNFAGKVQVRITGPANEARDLVTPSQFFLTATKQDGNVRSRYIYVNLSPGQFNLSSNYNDGGRVNGQVTLTQSDNARMQGRADRVTLNVSGAVGGAAQARGVQLSAPSFEALRRRHGKEVELYLRPLLQELGQEQMFAADPFLAWQVFASDYRPAEAMQQKVTRFLADLGAADFKVRDRAVEDLKALGHDGALALMRLDREALKLDLEQRSRLDAILMPYQSLKREEADELRDDPTFLLDCLAGPDEKIRALALAQLRKLKGEAIDFDLKADDRARAEQVAQLRVRLAGATTGAAPTDP